MTMYICEDLLYMIFKNIDNISDKNNFSQLNSDFYKLTYIEVNLEKKRQIEKYLYNDYIKFYKYLYHFDYSFSELIKYIGIILDGLNSHIIYKTEIIGVYDLRYIFELLFVIQKYKKNKILKDTLKTHNNYYLNFNHILQDSIISTNRYEAIDNLQKTHLTVFHSGFRPIPKNQYNKNYKDFIP